MVQAVQQAFNVTQVFSRFVLNVPQCWERTRGTSECWGGAVCGAHSAHVTAVAEEMGVQGEALRAGLIGELLPALLRRDTRRLSAAEG